MAENVVYLYIQLVWEQYSDLDSFHIFFILAVFYISTISLEAYKPICTIGQSVCYPVIGIDPKISYNMYTHCSKRPKNFIGIYTIHADLKTS